MVVAAAAPAAAVEARPWLCRDKPVFSSNSAISYGVANRGDRRWRLLLMQFEPGGAHDGFAVIATRDVAPAAAVRGSLAAGRYYAVGMYRRGGRWICPGYTQENEQPPAGALSQICYGDDPSDCPLTFSVFPAAGATAPH
jgi:hypothetical protein